MNINSIQPSFHTIVTNTAGATTRIDNYFNSVRTGDPIILRPSTGDFNFLSDTATLNRNRSETIFILPVKIDPVSGKIEAYLYLNGRHEPSETTTVHSPGGVYYGYYSYVRPENDPIRLTDTWYFIYVFQGTDGKDYQYRTPIMSVANAL